MAKLQKGKNLMVKVGGTIYGFATSCDLTVDVDTKEISSGSYKHSTAAGQWKEYDTERVGWSVNSEHLAAVGLTDEVALFKTMTAGLPVAISFEEVKSKTPATSGKLAGETGEVVAETSRKGFEGQAIITSFKLSASNDGDATYSITLQGTGSLTVLTGA